MVKKVLGQKETKMIILGIVGCCVISWLCQKFLEKQMANFITFATTMAIFGLVQKFTEVAGKIMAEDREAQEQLNHKKK